MGAKVKVKVKVFAPGWFDRCGWRDGGTSQVLGMVLILQIVALMEEY